MSSFLTSSLHATRARPSRRAPAWTGLALGLTLLLAACGGGDSGSSNERQYPYSIKPESDAQAVRFLTQTTFGPTPTDVSRVTSMGYEAWIDEQLGKPGLQLSHVDMSKAALLATKSDRPRALEALHTWWTQALNDPAQLRQRVAFALSEIMVVSSMDGTLGDNGLLLASYMDMLNRSVDGNYRQLLENVALHPAMGIYLSHRGNRKEDTKSGRVPDENFAREVMQLFSIGLQDLNMDGSPKLVNGKPVESYTSDDVKGLAKVFTGFSWWIPPDKTSLEWWRCFYRNDTCKDERQLTTSMSSYAQEHSITEKKFLGVTIAAQATADPAGDLRIALDRLASHDNTAPFISRQLIQRLVTSNPSPAYVAAVAQTFKDTGGSIKAVVKAILLHPEARMPEQQNLATYGKLREPVLRLSHLLRALPHTSDAATAARTAGVTPVYLTAETDNPGTALGQTPLRSASVFNFFRPGYTPTQTALGQQGLVAPELQTTSETSVIGYANFLADTLTNGFGPYSQTLKRRDVQFDLSGFDALADDPAALMDTVSRRLLGRAASEPLRTTGATAIGKMLNKTAADRRLRVQAAILLVGVSPDFTVQQ